MSSQEVETSQTTTIRGATTPTDLIAREALLGYSHPSNPLRTIRQDVDPRGEIA